MVAPLTVVIVRVRSTVTGRWPRTCAALVEVVRNATPFAGFPWIAFTATNPPTPSPINATTVITARRSGPILCQRYRYQRGSSQRRMCLLLAFSNHIHTQEMPPRSRRTTPAALGAGLLLESPGGRRSVCDRRGERPGVAPTRLIRAVSSGY